MVEMRERSDSLISRTVQILIEESLDFWLVIGFN